MSQRSLPVDIAFGTGHWDNDSAHVVTQREIVQALHRHKITLLDTSRHYAHGESEVFMGNEILSSTFSIITKAPSCVMPGGATREGIAKYWQESEAALQTKHVSMYLLHVPDDNTPISETMQGIQTLYLAGHFTQFGLSNFSAAQVEECHDYCLQKDYVLPTVYQSIYSLLVRAPEATLFPLLRRLNISIQAYSLLGSGFLVRSPSDIIAGHGNFTSSTVLGKILQAQYGQVSYLRFLEMYGEVAVEAGLSRAGIAYRWAVWNSGLGKGDVALIGASSVKQLDEVMEEIWKGPLEEWVVERLDSMWKGVEDDAPEHNFATYKRLLKSGLL